MQMQSVFSGLNFTCVPSELRNFCSKLQLYVFADHARIYLKEYDNVSGIKSECIWIESHLGNIDSDALAWITSFYM